MPVKVLNEESACQGVKRGKVPVILSAAKNPRVARRDSSLRSE